MKKNKILFMIMLIMSTIIIASSENWISMWMGIEINLMSFIPMMSEKKNSNTPKSMMIYFLVQSMTSMIMILMVMINPLMLMNNNINETTSKMIMMLSICMKMGLAPMHFWFIHIMSKMSWNNCFLLMTWQKLGPMMMISNIIMEKLNMLMIIMSTIVGAIGGINQTSIQKMLAYSSINHMGWMMLCMKTESDLWMKYWIIYSIITMMIMNMMKKNSMYHINQIMMNSKSKMEKVNIIMMMMSLGGLPPFIGFLPKWISIQATNEMENKMLIMMMMFMSIITLYYYMRMLSPMILMNNSKNKWMIKKSTNSWNMIMMAVNISMPIVLTINMI